MKWTLRDICEQTELEQDSGNAILCDRFHEGKLTVLVSVIDREGFPVEVYIPISALMAFMDRVMGNTRWLEEEVTFE